MLQTSLECVFSSFVATSVVDDRLTRVEHGGNQAMTEGSSQ